jgi:3-oxoacyl-[acyl-carrier-protein] synthase-3
MKSTFAEIIGVGHYVPERVLTNDDLAQMVETSDEWITSRTGIRQRRIAAADEYTSDMSLAAARAALAVAKIDPAEIDAIFLATATGDMVFPATACLVQNAIGATHAYGYDLSSACSGFLMGLETATAAIESGRAKTVLVIGAEKLSSITDWSSRDTCILFGDGAGAAILRASSRPGVLSTHLGVDGSLANVLSLPGGGSRHPATPQMLRDHLQYVHMSGRETFKSAVNVMADTAERVVKAAGLTFDDIDLMIPHQANLRIIEAVARKLGGDLMPRVFLNLDRFGNTSAASIPLALSDAYHQGKIKPGNRVLLVAFGGGLSWGGAVLEWTI